MGERIILTKQDNLVNALYKRLNKSYRPIDCELDLLGIDVNVKWVKHFITKEYLYTVSENNLALCLKSVMARIAKRSKKKKTKNRNWKNKETKYSFLRKSAKKSSSHSTVYVVLMWKGREKFIKVGMTTTSIEERFKTLPYNYKVVHSVDVDRLLLFEYEQALHGLCKKYKYRPSINFIGRTECYSIDAKKTILSLIG